MNTLTSTQPLIQALIQTEKPKKKRGRAPKTRAQKWADNKHVFKYVCPTILKKEIDPTDWRTLLSKRGRRYIPIPNTKYFVRHRTSRLCIYSIDETYPDKHKIECYFHYGWYENHFVHAAVNVFFAPDTLIARRHVTGLCVSARCQNLYTSFEKAT